MEKKKRILIIKIGAIGDAVMALSMLHEIDKKYPGAEITWICGKIIAPLIKSAKRIDEVIVIDDYKLLKGSTLDRLDVMSRVWLKLFGRSFDVVINAYRFKGYGLLALTALKKEVRDFSGRSRLNRFVSGRYHAEEYAKIVHGIEDWQFPDIVFPEIIPQQNRIIDNLLESTGHPRFVLTPGGAQNLINGGLQRRWPVEQYRLLAERLYSDFPGCTVILAGSKEDVPVLEYFKELPVIDLVGKSSLMDMIYLYNKSDVLVSHDTGLFHLAKLSAIKTVVLFGPVNPLERIGHKENISYIWNGMNLPCSPCYDGKAFAECTNNICMKNISVDNVVEKINEILK